jgi:hypothetical protein
VIVRLRKELVDQGLDAGPDTIAWHLRLHHRRTVSRDTISRYLARHGLVTPEPKKRPRSSYIRLQAALPNETWQADFTHYRLADGSDAEILAWLDAQHELRRLHVRQQNSTPNHPTTGGKVERFEQTMKNWLRALSKALPACSRDAETHTRVRHDRIGPSGVVTLRLGGPLHHIGVGRTHARTHVILLVDDLHVRVVNAVTGELLRELTIDPARDCQPQAKPKTTKPPNP